MTLYFTANNLFNCHVITNTIQRFQTFQKLFENPRPQKRKYYEFTIWSKRLANLKVTDYFDSVKHSEHPNTLGVNLDRSFISNLKNVR